MELGMIGLGRMGANMAERLLRGGHRVVGYDPQPEAMQRLTGKGGVGATSVAGLTERLTPPRTVWLMVPSGNPVDDTIEALLPSLSRGDTVTDGETLITKIRSAERAISPSAVSTSST